MICKVPRCGKPVESRQVLCKTHFDMISADLRRALNRLQIKNGFMPSLAWDDLMGLCYGTIKPGSGNVVMIQHSEPKKEDESSDPQQFSLF